MIRYLKAILIGIIASFFFASTFILNRSMELAGGSWIWSASLRFFFMVPFLLAIVGFRGKLKPLINEMKDRPMDWLLWSFIGFGLFYTPITFAAAFGPGWLVAGTWQTTIIAGSLLVPVITKNAEIPYKELRFSYVILVGVIILQVQQATTVQFSTMLLGTFPVLIAAFAYPLGNRKMMQICDGRLDTFQRVLGMTIASLPYWIILSIFGLYFHGIPTYSQITQSFLVAVCAGIIATVLFFYATDIARKSPKQLAAVESTQAGEIVFAVIGEIVFIGASIPTGWSLFGLVLIGVGMILHSLYTKG